VGWGGGGGLTLVIPNVGQWWRWVVSFMQRLFYPKGMGLWI